MFHEVTNSPGALTGINAGTAVTVQWLGTGRLSVQLDPQTIFYIWPNAVHAFLAGDAGITVFSENTGTLYYADA